MKEQREKYLKELQYRNLDELLVNNYSIRILNNYRENRYLGRITRLSGEKWGNREEW